MSNNHTGNILNQITYEEHDGELNAKKVSLVSSATIYAVVDIAAGETVGINSNVTLNPSPNFIGLVSIAQPVNANVSLGASAQYIGIVTVTNLDRTITGNVTLSDSKGFIGLATVIEGVSTSLVHGMVSSASGGLVQFPTNTIRWVEVRSMANNPTTCYVGGSSATINNGYPLDSGDAQSIPIDNTNRLYLVGVGTTEVRFIGGN